MLPRAKEVALIIASDRLLLRPMAPKDIDQFVRHLNDWEVQQWLTIPPFPYERSDGEAFLAIAQRNHATSHPTVFVIADLGTDDGIGIASVDIDADGTGELGYWLARSHWGRGLMKDAVAALVHHAKRHPALRRLVAVTDPGNLRSQRVLETCGFLKRGLADRAKPSRRGSTQVLAYEVPIER
jgi:8-oxo-dGTP diphosphatase